MLVCWLGNKCVSVVSSYLGGKPHDTVHKHDKKRKELINILRPNVIGVYNKSIGGVVNSGVLDMMCTLYKYELKSKRWYMYIFYHILTIALVNDWFVYKRDRAVLGIVKSLPFRKFRAHVATTLCKSGKPLRRLLLSTVKRRKVLANFQAIDDV